MGNVDWYRGEVFRNEKRARRSIYPQTPRNSRIISRSRRRLKADLRGVVRGEVTPPPREEGRRLLYCIWADYARKYFTGGDDSSGGTRERLTVEGRADTAIGTAMENGDVRGGRKSEGEGGRGTRGDRDLRVRT